MNIFRGDLTDVSCKTASLILAQAVSLLLLSLLLHLLGHTCVHVFKLFGLQRQVLNVEIISLGDSVNCCSYSGFGV